MRTPFGRSRFLPALICLLVAACAGAKQKPSGGTGGGAGASGSGGTAGAGHQGTGGSTRADGGGADVPCVP
ncbi:MAG: hypothetical protein ABUS79_30185, partial [Pseudomonadota bacterium]